MNPIVNQSISRENCDLAFCLEKVDVYNKQQLAAQNSLSHNISMLTNWFLKISHGSSVNVSIGEQCLLSIRPQRVR